jgi:hypothetical protein
MPHLLCRKATPRSVPVQTDVTYSTEDYVRQAHVMRSAAFAGMISALVRMLFRRKAAPQVSLG